MEKSYLCAPGGLYEIIRLNPPPEVHDASTKRNTKHSRGSRLVKVIKQAFGYRLLIFSLGDYDLTPNVHTGTYPEIDPAKTDFSGKAVFVTGRSRGIGRTIILRYEIAGALHIAAAARSDMSQLAKAVEAAAASANRRPPKFLPVRLGVSGPKIVADAAATIEKEFGMWDVLVDNAGIIGDLRLLGDSDPAGWTILWT